MLDQIWAINQKSKSSDGLGAYQLEACLALHLLQTRTLSDFGQDQSSVSVLEDSQLSDHHWHHSLCCQWKPAVLDQFQRSFAVFCLCWMLHQNYDLGPACHEVHRASHALHHLAWDDPVGNITVFWDLEGAKHGNVEMPASDDGERLRRRKVRSSRQERYSFLNIINFTFPALMLLALT